jgi:predicted CxxxxCH...CXXCH cytochrome family protein
MKRIRWFALGFTFLLVLSGCSNPSDEPFRSPHPTGFADPASAQFHGAQQFDLEECGYCHGADFAGGGAGLSCFECHAYPHLPGWAAPAGHGTAVLAADFDLDACRDCHEHSSNPDSARWDCYQCHVYYPHTDGITASRHGGIFASMHYQVGLCQTCHGNDYAGGAAGESCLNCHAYTPEACNTCHGTFNADPGDTLSWAPPPDLTGQTNPAVVSVGAHFRHLHGGNVGGPFSCRECHLIPAAVSSAGHLNDAPAQAEVQFGALAKNFGQVQPVWSHDQASCSGVYCHGNFELGLPANIAVWTNQDGSQIQCGRCHGMPPGGTHPDEDECSECHGSVVNQNLQIIAPTLHVNGQVNFN